MSVDPENIQPPSAAEPLDAYALLSKPTLDLSDAEVEVIVADLRRRRAAFLQGTPDKPKRAASPKAPAAKPTAESKKAALAQVLSQLDLKI